MLWLTWRSLCFVALEGVPCSIHAIGLCSSAHVTALMQVVLDLPEEFLREGSAILPKDYYTLQTCKNKLHNLKATAKKICESLSDKRRGSSGKSLSTEVCPIPEGNLHLI